MRAKTQRRPEVRAHGEKLLTWIGAAAIRRHSQVLPRYGDRKYLVRLYNWCYWLRWRKWDGLRLIAWLDETVPMPEQVWVHFDQEGCVGLKKREVVPGSLTMPDLPSATKAFAKWPTVVAFMTARSYEDGSPRLPGKIWFEGQPSGFCLTLIDVDQALRLSVRGPTIDDTLSVAELAIGAENSPWEIDEYQAARRAGKKSKK